MAGDDWLSKIASVASTIGSYVMPTNMYLWRGVNDNVTSFDANKANTGLLNDARNVGSVASNATSWLADHDISKGLTAPILSPLHGLGVGKEGDDWDKGLIGLVGTGFDKGAKLVNFVTLKGNQPGSDVFTNGTLARKAWDMAFSKEQPIDPGMAFASLPNESFLTDPAAIPKLHKQMDSTWYGNVAAGVISMGVYTVIDPTRGFGGMAKATRAANYISDPMKADRIAGIVNKALPNDESAAGATLGADKLTKAARVGNAAKAIAVGPMDDPAIAGRMMTIAGRFDHDTNYNSILGKLDPMMGNGSPAARLAEPLVAELFMDAGKIKDVGLQRQIKVQVELALTGGALPMKWLADNYPMIAAKGRRASTAPSEFTLLRDAMDDVEANGLSNFDPGKWIDSHYGSAANVAELHAYASGVADIRRFRQAVEEGDRGGLVDFGTSKLGVQVAPRTLEVLKTALNQRVMDSHLLQGGASGRTIRIVNGAVTPKAHGFIHIQDPIMGNKQLMDTLRTFNIKMKAPGGPEIFAPEYIQGMSERFLKATQSERGAIIDEVNDTLLAKVAEKYSPQSMTHRGTPLTPENVRQMIADSGSLRARGRAYAEAKVSAAKANGEPEAYFGDLGGADTAVDTAQMSSQLENTRFLWDWKKANEAVDGFYVNNRVMPKSGIGRADRFANGNTAQAIGWALRMWKHGVLMRPGLAVRAIEDTGLRSVVSIGAATTAMQAANGAWNVARNRGTGLLGDANAYARMAMTDADKANAARAARTIDTLKVQGEDQAVKILDRTLQNTNTSELAESLTNKIHHGVDSRPGAFHKMSGLYADVAQRAIDLGIRQRSAARTIGGEQPLGLKALNDEWATAAPKRASQIKTLEAAKARYEEGSLISHRSIATTPFTEGGIKWTAIKDDMDEANLIADITAGGSASDMFLGTMSHDWEGLKADLNHGSNHVAPDDAHWAQKMAVTATTVRGSYTGMRLLHEVEPGAGRTLDAVERSFLDDPKVLAELRSIRPGEQITRDDARAWLSNFATSVQSLTPTEAARAMMTGAKPVTAEMANALTDRFPIFGPDVYKDGTRKKIDTFYNVMLNMPDVTLARVPMFNGLYRANVRELLPAYVKRAEDEGRTMLTTKEQLQIHQRARMRSINDVRRDMYDVHRNVGAHGVMSMISPFFAPWEDAMMSWGRLLYDDPSRMGKLLLAAQTTDIFHIAIDKNGNKTQPWDGTAMGDKSIQIPLGGLMGLESMRANWGSFNSIQQGDVPFSPGAGPLVQLSATLLVADVLPKLSIPGTDLAPGAALWDAIASHPDNVVAKTFFPQGETPKAGGTAIVNSVLPSYGRKFLDAVLGNSGYSFGSIYPTAFGTRYGDLITQYRAKNGGKDPSKVELEVMQGQASNGARAAGIASAAMAFGIGISGNAAPEGQLYVDKMHALNQMATALAAQGLTPAGVFATMYPNAARLNWGFSVNDGHLQATVNATSSYYKNKTLMDRNKESGWWIAGPDNLLANLGDPDSAGKTFSQGAYNQQMNAGLRRRYSQGELVAQQDIAMGYGQMASFDSALSLYMRNNGIKSLNAKNAGNLGVMKNEFVTNLGLQFPEWERDRSTMDLQRKARQINQIQTIVENPPKSLADRPDVLTTQKYLFARQALVDSAHEQGITSWQTSKKQLADRYTLWQYGQTLAASDIVFQQAWSRLFESEFKGDLTPTLGA